jgi:hypothetical protein
MYRLLTLIILLSSSPGNSGGCKKEIAYEVDNLPWSVEFLVDQKLYGAFADTSHFSLSDDFGQALSNSLDTQKGLFCENPWITWSYSFEKAPCIKIFLLSPRKEDQKWPLDKNDWVIFNACDSSACLFGSTPNEFYKTTKILIGNNASEQDYMDYILFYLSTRSFKNYYYFILKSSLDFDLLYNDYVKKGYYNEGSALYPSQKINKDIESVHKIVKPPLLTQSGAITHIKLFTWEDCGGDIDYWHFEITQETMKDIDRKTILHEVGPYKMILH